MGTRSEPPPWEESTHARHRTLHRRICEVEDKVVSVEEKVGSVNETLHKAHGGFRVVVWLLGIAISGSLMLVSWMVVSTVRNEDRIEAAVKHTEAHSASTGHADTIRQVGELRVQGGRVEAQVGEINRRLGSIEKAITTRPEPAKARRPRR